MTYSSLATPSVANTLQAKILLSFILFELGRGGMTNFNPNQNKIKPKLIVFAMLIIIGETS